MTISEPTSSPAESDSSKRALVIGATASLGIALCRALAKRGWTLTLAGRDAEELARLENDITARYRLEAQTLTLDLLAAGFSPQAFLKHAGIFDAVFLLAGDMGSGDADDPANIERTVAANFTRPVMLLAQIGQDLAARGSGSIVVVGSVAGDRGRGSNYVYGSAKAGLAAFASGLRNRLHAKGVHVMTVKPGFIDTPMTFAMKSPLIARREAVAESILQAMENKQDVLYVPWFWRFIMFVIRSIPERIFKRLSL